MKPSELIQEITASLLAIIALLGTFGIISYQLARGEAQQIPDIVIAFDFAIISSFLTQRASVNGARQSGTAAAQTAIAANKASGNVGSTSGTT